MSVRPPELPIPGWAMQLGARAGVRLPMPEARLLAMIAGPTAARDIDRAVNFWRARGQDGLVPLSQGTRLVVGHSTAFQVLRHADAGNSRDLVDPTAPTGAYDRLGRHSIAYLDGPDHRRLRRLVSPHLDSAAAAARSESIRGAIRARLEALGDSPPGSFDVMDAVVVPVVASLVGDLCGVPVADRLRVAEWMAPAERRWRRTPFVGPLLRRRSDEGLEAFGEWLPRVAARGELDDGVFKTLAAESEVGHDATIGTAFFVYGAARVTVERFLGSAVRTLAEVGPKLGEWPPRVTPELIDELLRWDPPAAVAARVTKADLILGSTDVPAETQLVVLMRVVNRDPATFDDPDRFVADRNPNPHLAFSAGAHFCLGAPLARVEGSVVLEELLGWLGAYEVMRGPVEGVGLPHRPITRLLVSRR